MSRLWVIGVLFVGFVESNFFYISARLDDLTRQWFVIIFLVDFQYFLALFVIKKATNRILDGELTWYVLETRLGGSSDRTLTRYVLDTQLKQIIPKKWKLEFLLCDYKYILIEGFKQ